MESKVRERAGDEPASEAAPSFREMFDANFAYIARTLRRLGVRSGEIEDAAQDVFAAIYGKWNDYDPTRPLRPWLFSFAFRVAANWRRKAQRTPEGEEDSAEILDPASPEQTPERTLIERQTRALVLTVLNRMPFERRDIFVMHDIEGLDAKAIAELVGVPPNTVYSRLRVARQEFEAGIAQMRRKIK